jgi:hypothetical protein
MDVFMRVGVIVVFNITYAGWVYCTYLIGRQAASTTHYVVSTALSAAQSSLTALVLFFFIYLFTGYFNFATTVYIVAASAGASFIGFLLNRVLIRDIQRARSESSLYSLEASFGGTWKAASNVLITIPTFLFTFLYPPVAMLVYILHSDSSEEFIIGFSRLTFGFFFVGALPAALRSFGGLGGLLSPYLDDSARTYFFISRLAGLIPCFLSSIAANFAN